MSETADVRVQETNKADGSKQIEVMIVQKIKQAIADGSLDRSFRGAYGLSRNPA
jgi:anti-sigma28 factor (negative regulator of flagellin synthesis)